MYKYLIIWACYICSNAVYGQSCSQVFVSSITDFTATTATINWIYPGTDIPLGYEIELGKDGFIQTGTPTTDLISSTTFVYTDLENAQTYQFWIRAVCQNGSSDWNGPFEFNTNITNPSFCPIDLAIDNNNCPDVNQFNIEITDYPGALLGQDIILDQVELIITHTWIPDLKIELQSPNGVKIPLIQHRGIGSQNLGDVNNCEIPLSFTADACLPIEDAPTPYIGTYRPEGDLNRFLDGSSVNGIWTLEICDRAKVDIGTLNYIALGFSEQNCTLPFTIRITEIKGNSVLLNWDRPINCDGIELEVGPLGFLPGSVPTTFVNCEAESLLIENLDIDTEYEFYIRSVCGATNSAYSCPFTFTTACGVVSNQTSFDQNQTCPTNCNQACDITNTWRNSDIDDHDWIVHTGATPTDFTGPASDANDYGNYIYIENTQVNCTAGAVAILESDCLMVSDNADGCDLQFRYHMYGSDITALRLDITLDDGVTWSTIWEQEGDQGNQWLVADTDLSNFSGSLARLRFVAHTGTDIFSDIAIDEITFFNSTLEEAIMYYFDEDSDGFGLTSQVLESCTSIIPTQYANLSGDCNDQDASINPTADESPCNLIDDDCDGLIDNVDTPNPIEYSISVLQNESCTGAKDGRLELVIVGGAPPYNIVWNDNQTGDLITNATEGIYFAIIMDDDGCQIQTEFIEIDVNNTVEVFLESIEPESCQGSSDGSLEIIAGGGQEPYTILWSNGMTGPQINNLISGEYHVVVTDAIGCQSDTVFYNIDADPFIVAGVASIEHVRCHADNNGSLSIGIINGQEPYDIQWSTGEEGATLSNLKAGIYEATITDANNCTLRLDPIEITQPDSIAIQIDNLQRISCPTEQDGRIEISIVGGEGPFTYQWSNGKLTDDLFQLDPGYYSITVTDSQACQATKDSILIGTPPPLLIDIDSIIHVDCPLSTDGAILASVTGGNGEYSYFWSHESGLDSNYVDGLSPGFYRLTSIDRFGCKVTKGLIEVESMDREIMIDLSLEQANDCADESNAVIAAEIDDAEFPVAYNWSYGVEHIESALSDTLRELPAGMYNITVTDRDGCTGISEVLTIDEVASLSFDIIEVIDNSCESDSSGQISLSIENATLPAQVIWNDGSTGNTIANLPNGSYMASITDSKGCEAQTQEININSEFLLSYNSITVAETDGLQNGSITIIPEGNAADYFIIWEDYPQYDGQFFVENLSTGTYIITLMDSNGCMYTNQVMVDVISSTNSESNTTIEIYPNPAQNQLIITLDNGEIFSGTLQILDLKGTSVLQEELNDLIIDQEIFLSVKNFPSGIYILRIQTATKHMVSTFTKF